VGPELVPILKSLRADARIDPTMASTGSRNTFAVRRRCHNHGERWVVAGQAVKITEAEERELRRRASQYTRPYREVIRAKLVLLAA
jgi:hypothetical protein